MLKKCEIEMLSTREKAPLVLLTDRKLIDQNSIMGFIDGMNQHLYVTSDDKITKGDNVYDMFATRIFKVDNVQDAEVYNKSEYFKKVVISTDKNLGLPTLSRGFILQFIKNHNQGSPIYELLVRYNDVEICESTTNYDYNNIYVNGECVDTLNHESVDAINNVVSEFTKPHENNGVASIKKMRTNFSRQEVYNLLKMSIERTTNSFVSSDIEWVHNVLDK